MLKTARRGIDTNQEGHSPCLLMVSVMSAEFPFLRAQSNDHDGVTKRKHFCQSYQPCYDLVHPQFIHSVIATSFTGAQKLVIKPRDNADPGCASKHMALQCCTMLSCCYCVLLICAAIPRIAISLEGEEALPSRSNDGFRNGRGSDTLRSLCAGVDACFSSAAITRWLPDSRA